MRQRGSKVFIVHLLKSVSVHGPRHPSMIRENGKKQAKMQNIAGALGDGRQHGHSTKQKE
jgi:hypothetical protein